MNDGQLPLDLDLVARATDPDTSWSAARDAARTANTHRGRVYRALERVAVAHSRYPEKYPCGLTDYELADLLGLQQNSAGKRRGELRDAGLVEDSGERRKAPSGSSAIVWRVVATPTLGDRLRAVIDSSPSPDAAKAACRAILATVPAGPERDAAILQCSRAFAALHRRNDPT